MRIVCQDKLDGSAPPVHLSRCEHCFLWGQSRYMIVGRCRRYPYPQTCLWDRCPCWSSKHEYRLVLAEFSRPEALRKSSVDILQYAH